MRSSTSRRSSNYRSRVVSEDAVDMEDEAITVAEAGEIGAVADEDRAVAAEDADGVPERLSGDLRLYTLRNAEDRL